jgi:hypothetical protein
MNRSLERLRRSLRNAVRGTAIISSIGIATPGAFCLGRSAAVGPVGLGPWASGLSSPFAGTECSILVSANPVAAAQFSRRLYSRVMVVMIRRTGFFHPCRQKLQIEKIDRLDGRRAHHVHLLERAKGSKRRPVLRLHHYLKMIDILVNSFTCDAVPGLSGISWI